MRFYYIRHGEPIYDPDSLTERGHEQAARVSEWFAQIGLDKVYSSTSNRALQTAEPTCKALGLDVIPVDFANEAHAWRDFTVTNGSQKSWIFQNETVKELFCTQEIKDMSYRWYEHSAFDKYTFKDGMERVYNESDAFFAKLGYEHIRYSGKYKAIAPNDEKVALFAHEGFGKAFLSCLLDIPYPYLCNHFNLCHAGITVIDFPNKHGEVIVNLVQISMR